MKPSEYRDRLFRKGKPNIREIKEEDIGVLWAAYKFNSFPDIKENLEKEDFTFLMNEIISSYDAAWMVEDSNTKFSSGIGPVGIVAARFDGWALEPKFEPFSWATKRNRLRANVAFFQMMKYDRNVGVVNVYSLDRHKSFFKALKKYGVLNFAGRIPHGDYRGDRYIFYVRGRAKAA